MNTASQFTRNLPVSDHFQPIAAILIGSVRVRWFTRAFDFTCAALGLILLSPVLTLIACSIKAMDRGPVFYRQERVGKSLRSFQLMKFRTMVIGADREGLLTAPGDARVTRIGRFLRRHKLDELPQLFNVLSGDMQLVGVRPEVPQFVEKFRSQYEVLLQQPPGLTDPASIAYRDEEKFLSRTAVEEQYLTNILPHKLQLSHEYQNRQTFLSDLSILVRTLMNLV